ncbi:MAG: alkaline phosphatase [Verrucomicrobiia bacterium]
MEAGRVLALFDDAELPYRADLSYWFPNQKRPTQHPLLSDMVRRAIELLQYRVGGYLLVVDSALTTRAIAQNQAKRAVGEILDLDIAVKTARKYAGKNALILVVSGYNMGGLTVHGSFPATAKGNVFFESQTNAMSAITWMSGPGALPRTPKEQAEWQRLQQQGLLQTNSLTPDYRQPAFLQSSQAFSTAGDSLVLASGPGAEKIHGILENTDLFEIINSEL